MVYVCGAVENPGVYELPENSRVYEAVAMAGGMTEDAGMEAVNQAELVTDGQMLRKAEALFQYREAHGRFSSIEEIMNVDGIKEGVFNKIKDSIKV